MERRPIGDTGLAVTPIGYGASGLGSMPDTYGYAVDEGRARDTLARVFEGPVNLLDTSRNYGAGRSEERIGAAIRDRGGLPEGFVLSTKLDRDMDTGRFDGARARSSFEESLTALGLDRVQILHLHDPEHAADLTEITGRGGALEMLFRLRDEGMATAVGLAMGRVEMMRALLADWPFDVLITHNRFTLLNRQAEALFDLAARRGTAIFNAAPFAGGVLAKGSGQTRRIAYQETDETGLAPVRAIEAVCARHVVAPGAAALQFSARDPRITSTIVGVSRPDSIDRTLDWAAAPIPGAAWDALAALPFSTDDPEANRLYRPG